MRVKDEELSSWFGERRELMDGSQKDVQLRQQTMERVE